MTSILIIDDDEQIRYLFKRKLEQEGYKIFVEDDGDPGLKSYIKNKPDLILLDIIMPGKEGIEVIREMVSMDKNVKIIAISAGGRGSASDYLEYARRFGAKRVLEKPVDLKVLVETVKEVLG